MKKIYRIFICFTLFLAFFSMPLTANADTGPKPSVVVNFDGIDDQVYYATLLSERESTGPWSLGNDYYDYMGDESVFWKFSEYEDSDGYYFLSFMDDCSEDDTLDWGYYPPEKFKILVYFPETDQFVCSEGVCERYAFDSYFTAKISGENVSADMDDVSSDASTLAMSVQQSYDYSQETISLIARVIITIAIEIVIALLFGYRNKKSLQIIVITNIITQIVLNVLLNLINYYGGHALFILNYVWMEIVVFIIEAMVFSKLVDGKHVEFKRGVPYALVANVASLIVGMAIAQVLPGIF